jgi:leader peptidase (prepilin peptidase)/N-methyltransferase
MIRILGTVFAGLFGLLFGSFLNVCLSRWPEGESVVKPRSHCSSCGRTLKWWENVPLISWLALRRRCRTCGERIGWRHPLVELATGVLWATIAWQSTNLQSYLLSASSQGIPVSFSPHFLLEATLEFAGKMIFIWMLVGLAALDADRLWLPDIVTIPGVILGAVFMLLGANSMLPAEMPAGSPILQLLYLAFAILASAGMILLIRWAYSLVRKREGIGLGDAKLMAMLGAWLGFPGALLAFAIGVTVAAFAALIVLAIPRRPNETGSWATIKLPLGTFLSIGGIVSALWGHPMISAYLRWAGF